MYTQSHVILKTEHRESRKHKQTNHNKETETILNNIHKDKHPRLDEFTGKFYQTLREELFPLLCKIFQNYEYKEIVLNTLNEANITLIPKINRATSRKENFRAHS